jgi:flagellin
MISIQTNLDSLIAQQNLSVNNQFQSNTIQQLTSGYRINSSADDAAGLSVANGYRNQIAELNQGVLNANQGVSQLQIIDGGLSNVSQMLDRLQTLATESASTTFTGNRQTLNTEYQGLLSEIGRQADNIGLGDNNAANATNLGVYIGGGQSSEANASVNVNLTGKSVSAIGLGLAGTSVLNTPQAILNTTAATQIAVGDTDTFIVATAAGEASPIKITGKATDTLQGQVAELNAQMTPLGITASLNNQGQLQLQSSNAFSVSGYSSTSNTGDLVLAGTAASTTNTVANTGLYNQTYAPVAGDTLTISVGSSTTQTITMAEGGTDSTPDQNMVNTVNQALQAAGITTVSAVLDESANTGTPGAGVYAGISLQGSTAFTVSGAQSDGTTPLVLGTTTSTPSTDNAPVGNWNTPTTAINAIAEAVQNLGQVQGVVGAGENTLNYAINLAQSQVTSFSAAQSQIRDANVAEQAANLTKAQVLQQASIAAMAQANQEPQSILALLKQ